MPTTAPRAAVQTLIDANHCPGAVMIVAHPPGPGVAPVLHTGDCRLLPDMQAHAALRALVGKAVLVLDTTYCDPQYTFPSQKDTLKFVMGAWHGRGAAKFQFFHASGHPRAMQFVRLQLLGVLCVMPRVAWWAVCNA
eukprot:359189-Chlamydomonas_euryale.AAC.2